MNRNLQEHRILKHSDLCLIESFDNGEKLVDLSTAYPQIVAKHKNLTMRQYTGDKVLVRESVAKLLNNIAKKLSNGQKLKVVFGYRHPDIQEKLFNIECDRISAEDPGVSDIELIERAHALIAVPDVAGHPTGGAVDVTILDVNGTSLDMGTAISDFSREDLLPTFASGLNAVQAKNRQLLHDMMVSGGFAPFYGEWWHFSYGDKEWAAFYGRKSSLYKSVEDTVL